MPGIFKDLKEEKLKDLRPSRSEQQLIDFKEIRSFYYDEEKAVLQISTKLMAYDPKKLSILERFANELLTKEELKGITTTGQLNKFLTDKMKELEIRIVEMKIKRESSRSAETFLTVKQKINLVEDIIRSTVGKEKILRCLKISNSMIESSLEIEKRPVTIHRLNQIPLEPPGVGEYKEPE